MIEVLKQKDSKLTQYMLLMLPIEGLERKGVNFIRVSSEKNENVLNKINNFSFKNMNVIPLDFRVTCSTQPYF